MGYEFSWGAFMVGFLVIIAGTLLLRFYQPLADNFGSGAISYDRFKLAGLIGVIAGFVIMTSLHTVLLGWFINLFI